MKTRSGGSGVEFLPLTAVKRFECSATLKGQPSQQELFHSCPHYHLNKHDKRDISGS